jgi:molecular chaperone GrpE
MSELKVTDRRWWAKAPNEAGEIEDEPETRPSYVVELEQKLAAKDEEIQRLISQYKSASTEFDDARARLRKEVSKDVERGRRSLIVSFLEVLDNLDRALEAVPPSVAASDPFVAGVAIVRQQFLSTLEGLGVKRLDPLGQPFDPALHEAVSSVPAQPGGAPNVVVGIVRPGYLMGDEVLRPAAVAVSA